MSISRASAGAPGITSCSRIAARVWHPGRRGCVPSTDELERRPRRPEAVDPFPARELGQAASPTYDPAARYAIREGLELALLRAIQDLPGRQRAVLIFRDVLGWTAPEVADLLESTVAS